MKAKELMIGDWARLVDNGKPQFRVAELHDDKVWVNEEDTQFLQDWFYGDIEPIPLTDAILKTNGFEYRHKNFAALSYEHPFQLEMVEWPNENGIGLWVIGGLLKIRYVHELQHALRLCGVDKELIVG